MEALHRRDATHTIRGVLPPVAPTGHHPTVPSSADRRVLNATAWVVSAIALLASASGWFAVVVGLPMGVLGLVLARLARNRRALFLAAVAVAVALAWLLIDLLV